MKAFVTGGNGFLGGAIVSALRKAGHEATAASRATGVDIGDADSVKRSMEGHDIVFHVAAKTGVWGPPAEFERTNVVGTENVLAACRSTGVSRLVFTGSPSCVFDGKDHRNAGNDLPYPTTFESDYPRTKAISEAMIKAANGPQLATVSIRPHLIWGPRDPHLLPRLVTRARQGRLRIIGDGTNEVSITYIDNAAAAHLQAAAALAPGSACAGQAYFVNDAEPVQLWDWLNRFLGELGIAPITASLPLSTARTLGGALEFVYRTLRLSGEPPITRFVASQLATSHSYDLGPARRDFGYAPPVDAETAFLTTISAWKASLSTGAHR